MSNYIVGQEVGFGTYGNHGLYNTGFSTIVKINGFGHIKLANDRVFDKHGNERAKYSRLLLVDADNLRKSNALADSKRQRRATVSKIEEILASARNGYGDVCPLGDERKAQLVQLVNTL